MAEKLKKPRNQWQKERVKREHCQRNACRNHFYNGHNDVGVQECMFLAEWPIGWIDVYFSIHQRKPTRVRTMSCLTPHR
jgi:hypothetical protein